MDNENYSLYGTIDTRYQGQWKRIVLTELLQAMQDSINHYKTFHMDASITLPLTVYPMQLADVTIEEEYHTEHSGI